MNGGGHVTKTGSALIAAAAILAGLVTAAESQNFPIKPIRVVASEPGGGGDFVARLIAQGMSGGLGQQVLVDNRGGSVIIPAEIVAKAPADGYTLLLIGSTLWIEPLMRKTPYDPVRDFIPVTQAAGLPLFVLTHPSLPVKNVKELIALAKAQPGKLNYSSSGAGGSMHVAAELFQSMAQVKLVHVPYKGGGPAIVDLLAGQVPLSFATVLETSQHVKAGRLRALAVTSAKRSVASPDILTVAEAALPGYESISWLGVFAPTGTPREIIAVLNTEIVKILQQPDVKQRLLEQGGEPIGNTQEQFTAVLKSDIAKYAKIMRESGTKVE